MKEVKNMKNKKIVIINENITDKKVIKKTIKNAKKYIDTKNLPNNIIAIITDERTFKIFD